MLGCTKSAILAMIAFDCSTGSEFFRVSSLGERNLSMHKRQACANLYQEEEWHARPAPLSEGHIHNIVETQDDLTRVESNDL